MYIELIEPIENDSPVKKFSESGGGFHHLCFEVENIFEDIERMKKSGARVIVEPTTGFEDRLIAFVLLNMKNIEIKITKLIEVTNLKFFINKTTKTAPNINKISGILFPASNVDVR